jgi:hypothetical protein
MMKEYVNTYALIWTCNTAHSFGLGIDLSAVLCIHTL